MFSLENEVESLGTIGKHMQATIFSKIWYSQTVVFAPAVFFKFLKHYGVMLIYRVYTVKKVIVFPVPSRDVTNQTLPGWELLNYSRPGRV
jgi:hypothetical protein